MMGRNTSKRISAAISLIIAIIWFFTLRYIIVGTYPIWGLLTVIIYPYDYILQSAVTIITFLAINAILLGIFIYQILINKINYAYAFFVNIIYNIALIVAIMNKSRGISGYNFNIFDLAYQLHYDPLISLFNLLVFIPCGIAFNYWMKSNTKAIVTLSTIIILCEILQPILRTGFFDIVDIILNILGALSGIILADLFKKRGWILRQDRKTAIIGKADSSRR
ncbi:VanZ family protein [Bifidobacterium vespertilionis]|uniref:VanZ family protein n=1 Tax=Bifidobacterium vespertilionis TaxID=2562524 RepID=UPI001BDD2842|nr:VanZ family protein [Bifidobacterium vespertilionis]MBT1178912.1 VanZ family protein [Bifidobacterium vespertilionis]